MGFWTQREKRNREIEMIEIKKKELAYTQKIEPCNQPKKIPSTS